MKETLKALLLLSALALTSCNSKKAALATEKSFNFSDEKSRDIDKIAYSLGMQYAQSMRGFGLDSSSQDIFIQGLANGFKTEKKLDPEMVLWAKKIDKILMAKREKVASKKREEGALAIKKLLEEDASYNVSDSGLIYKITKMGKIINIIDPEAFVEMRYVSKYLNDKVYESTMTGNPRKLPLRGIFKAWTEAFSICGYGCEIEVIAPPALTYGNNGALPYIQPGEYLKYNLIFIKYIKKGL
jgi:FKBP-type peptidyl-prolyl cis-trans isomerase FklB